MAPDAGSRAGDKPEQEPEMIGLRALLGGQDAQLVLEHVDRLLPAAPRVERDRVLAREAVADLLVLVGLGVLAVGLELDLVHAPHPQADLLLGEDEPRALEVGHGRGRGLLEVSPGPHRLVGRVGEHALEKKVPAAVGRLEVVITAGGEFRPRLVDPLVVRRDQARAQVPSGAPGAREGLENPAGPGHVAVIEERRRKRQREPARVRARRRQHRAIEGDGR
jgi:hypothetical protein